MREVRRSAWYGLALLAGVLLCTPKAVALIPESPNYKLDESSIGTGNPLQQSSNNYNLKGGTGTLGTGNASSSNFQIDAGANTSAEPVLAFAVNSSTTNLGVFSPTTAATATASFSVKDYTSYGYTVQLVGKPPSNGPHTIPALATSELSQTGTEQFGINLVANTSPTSVGANPDNGQFGFGSIEPDYNTPNYYRYVSGDVIARSNKSSGITNYTITYVVNVAGLTPGGKYTSNQTLVVLGTY